jgi:hypothetical protein
MFSPMGTLPYRYSFFVQWHSVALSDTLYWRRAGCGVMSPEAKIWAEILSYGLFAG